MKGNGSGDERDDEEPGDDPFAELGAGATADDGTDPFAELAGATRDDGAETTGTDEPGGGDAGAFDAVDVGRVEAEDVWASLEDGTERPEVSLEGEPEPLDGGDHRVPKREYCGRCPFFADPPEVACTHEGTSIVAVEDAEQFRVRNCPMVDGPPPGGER